MKRRKFLKTGLLTVPAFYAPSLLLSSCKDDTNIGNGKSVIVVGAGMAGLAAAVKLKSRGFTVTVLEAQTKSGGRIKTTRVSGFPFDEGASWIHGPNGNPLKSVADKAGATYSYTDFDNAKYYDTNGTTYANAAIDNAYTEYDQMMETLSDVGTVNKNFETVFNEQYPGYLSNRLWKHILAAETEFDIGPLKDLSSIDYWDDEEFGGADKFITNGYDTLIKYLESGLDIQFNKVVTSINYSGDKVVVTTGTGTAEADFVIMATPLGVYKNNAFSFSPALPAAFQQAISKIKMNVVNKFFLTWNTPFWDNSLDFFYYTPEVRGKFNIFLNAKKIAPTTNALVTYALSDFALETEGLTDDAVTTQIMGNLKNIFGNSIPNPVSMYRTKWGTNPYAYGAYSMPTNNSRTTEFEVWENALDSKVFFAGEHTIRDYRASVHGAYMSGERAAQDIINLL